MNKKQKVIYKRSLYHDTRPFQKLKKQCNIILDLYPIFDCFLPRIHSEYYLNKTINETHLLPDILGIILFILSQTKAI